MECKTDLELSTTWGCSRTGPVAGRSCGSGDSAHQPLCTSSPATAQTQSRPGVCPDSPDPGGNRLACSRCLSHRSWASCCVCYQNTLLRQQEGWAVQVFFWTPQHNKRSPWCCSKHERCRPVKWDRGPVGSAPSHFPKPPPLFWPHLLVLICTLR